MKKFFIVFAIVVIAFCSCKKEPVKSTALTYNGNNPIKMALCDTVSINATSDYDITVKSLNDKYVTVIGDMKIFGKNVGDAGISISNGHEEMTIPVNIGLFLEPTFNFGCSKNEVIDYHGNPDYNFGDTILVYGNYNYVPMFVSLSCTQMNFYFSKAGKYYESDVYIKSKYEALLNKYLDDGFVYDSIHHVNDTVEYNFYHQKTNPNIVCGRMDNANKWNDVLLFYYKKGSKAYMPKRDWLQALKGV